MILDNEIVVDVSIDYVWAALNDPERVAPCLPGAQLQEIDGDQMRGLVKVKVGPITAQYKGAASYEERNEDERRIVIKGEGRGTSGNASALITIKLTSITPERTIVAICTDLAITGKVAQFGQRAIADVSTKLLSQFATNLEAALGAPVERPPTDQAVSELPSQGTARKIDSPEPEAVNMLAFAGRSIFARAAVALAVLAAVLVGVRLRRR